MKITQMSKGEKLNSNKRNQHLRLLLLEYTQGIIDMASNVTSNNINQIISLIKLLELQKLYLVLLIQYVEK